MIAVADAKPMVLAVGTAACSVRDQSSMVAVERVCTGVLRTVLVALPLAAAAGRGNALERSNVL